MSTTGLATAFARFLDAVLNVSTIQMAAAAVGLTHRAKTARHAQLPECPGSLRSQIGTNRCSPSIWAGVAPPR